MPASLLKPFSDMAHVDFSLPCRQMWAPAVSFQQQNSKMSLSTMGFSDMKWIEVRQIIDVVRTNFNAHVCVCEFLLQGAHGGGGPGVFDGRDLSLNDTVGYQRGHDKNKKFAAIHLFTSSDTHFVCWSLQQQQTQALISPWCLTTFLQERGRLVRKDEMTGNFAIIPSYLIWLILVLSVMVPPSKNLGPVPDQLCPLILVEHTANSLQSVADLVGVVNVLFMLAWGCLHRRCECFFSPSPTPSFPHPSRTSMAITTVSATCATTTTRISCCRLCTREHYNFLNSGHLRTGLQLCNPLSLKKMCSRFKVWRQITLTIARCSLVWRQSVIAVSTPSSSNLLHQRLLNSKWPRSGRWPLCWQKMTTDLLITKMWSTGIVSKFGKLDLVADWSPTVHLYLGECYDNTFNWVSGSKMLTVSCCLWI